ncbi:MAG TPA: hypothetical protein VFP80_12490 [Thermoanaerobaculia bacterium]|nr:hypothetical protein [Thermoanaerobaculia bacterium]
MTRARVRQWLEDRFFLRIHMTLILLGTFLGGLVATRMLMEMGVRVLALRYAIAVCLAYLVFLVLLKLWLMYVGSGGHSPVDAGDGLDLALDEGPGAGSLRLSGGGSGSSSSLDLDVGGDLEGLIFMIVLIVIVLLLGGIAVYYIYTAPALLSEAAFEAVLAASIARRAKKSEGTGWLGAVTRATVGPFLAVLALSILLGWLAQRRCPDALKLRDAVNCVR